MSSINRLVVQRYNLVDFGNAFCISMDGQIVCTVFGGADFSYNNSVGKESFDRLSLGHRQFILL